MNPSFDTNHAFAVALDCIRGMDPVTLDWNLPPKALVLAEDIVRIIMLMSKAKAIQGQLALYSSIEEHHPIDLLVVGSARSYFNPERFVCLGAHLFPGTFRPLIATEPVLRVGLMDSMTVAQCKFLTQRFLSYLAIRLSNMTSSLDRMVRREYGSASCVCSGLGSPLVGGLASSNNKLVSGSSNFLFPIIPIGAAAWLKVMNNPLLLLILYAWDVSPTGHMHANLICDEERLDDGDLRYCSHWAACSSSLSGLLSHAFDDIILMKRRRLA